VRRTALLSSGFLSPRSTTELLPHVLSQPISRLRGPSATRSHATSPGFLPLQRSKQWVPAFAPILFRSSRPGDSILRLFPSSGFLTPSTAFFTHYRAGLFHPARAPGVPPEPAFPDLPFGSSWSTRSGSPLQGLPPCIADACAPSISPRCLAAPAIHDEGALSPFSSPALPRDQDRFTVPHPYPRFGVSIVTGSVSLGLLRGARHRPS